MMTPEPATGRAAADRCNQTSLTVSSGQTAFVYLQTPLERPFNYAYEPPAGTPWENYQREEHAVGIADARHLVSRTTVHREGFALWDAPSAVHNFLNPDESVRCYYHEVAELARAATGIARYALHAEFRHPDAPAEVPPRESIEADASLSTNDAYH